MGFCWLCSGGGFWLVVLRQVFVGYGGQIYVFGRAQRRRRRFGRGLWVSPSIWVLPLVWPWAMGHGCGARFFFAWVAR